MTIEKKFATVGIGAGRGASKGKVTFSVGEEEFIEYLTQFGITRLEAIDQVIRYKQEQVVYHTQQGNEAVVEQLKRELGEL